MTDAEPETVMTPEEFAAEMRALADADVEVEHTHVLMDELLCKVLLQLGYGDGVSVFNDTHKWYA